MHNFCQWKQRWNSMKWWDQVMKIHSSMITKQFLSINSVACHYGSQSQVANVREATKSRLPRMMYTANNPSKATEIHPKHLGKIQEKKCPFFFFFFLLMAYNTLLPWLITSRHLKNILSREKKKQLIWMK